MGCIAFIRHWRSIDEIINEVYEQRKYRRANKLFFLIELKKEKFLLNYPKPPAAQKSCNLSFVLFICFESYAKHLSSICLFFSVISALRGIGSYSGLWIMPSRYKRNRRFIFPSRSSQAFGKSPL